MTNTTNNNNNSDGTTTTKDKKLIIMRGISGSGKSTLSSSLLKESYSIPEALLFKHIFTSDDYFVNRETGLYEFNPARLGRAHEWNQGRVERAMQRSVDPIIVDNTNTQFWEMKTYVQYAVQHGYSVEFREPDTPWKFDAQELAKRNVHNVPLESIQRMLDRWERDPTVEKVLQSIIPRRNRPRRGGRGGGGRGRGRGGRGGHSSQSQPHHQQQSNTGGSPRQEHQSPPQKESQ